MDDGRPAIILQADVAAWRACRGYAENMARAIHLVTTHPAAAGRVYHVAMPNTPTVAEWVAMIGREAGWSGEVVTMPREELPPALQERFNPAHHWLLDTSRIRAELGYTEPVPTAEALRRTIAYRRAHPPADPNDPFDYALEDAVLGR
jgi:nucleoside-diphosphate-sugar epimerase